MKKNIIKLYMQVAIVTVLATVGLVVMCGEAADWFAFGVQVLVAASNISAAVYFARKWQVIRKMNHTQKLF